MSETTFGRKYAMIFGGIIILAGVVISTVVFPFWNLIRTDVVEEVIIISNHDGICAADTTDNIPKIIQDCQAQVGDVVNIRYGEGLAWAQIVP